MSERVGIRVADLRPCDKCGGKISPVFYRLSFEQLVIDPESVNEFLGLRQMLGGSSALADVFQSKPDAAQRAHSGGPFVLCQECFFGENPVGTLWESEKANAAVEAARKAR